MGRARSHVFYIRDSERVSRPLTRVLDLGLATPHRNPNDRMRAFPTTMFRTTALSFVSQTLRGGSKARQLSTLGSKNVHRGSKVCKYGLISIAALSGIYVSAAGRPHDYQMTIIHHCRQGIHIHL